MPSEIDITMPALTGMVTHIVGTYRLPTPSGPFAAVQTVDGLLLRAPVSVDTDNRVLLPHDFLLSEVSGEVRFAGHLLGTARDSRRYRSANLRVGSSLDIHLTQNALRRLESLRAGRALKLTFELRGEKCMLFRSNGQAGGPVFRSEPLPWNGTAEVDYGKDSWVEMLNTTGLGENVVVELPLPPCPSTEWQPVWDALRSARLDIQRGGETAWRSAITSCRLALEKWQGIEAADQGTGLVPRERTTAQRRDAVRWHLYQCAHEAAHSHAENWSREEAVFMLAALTGLIAVRNP